MPIFEFKCKKCGDTFEYLCIKSGDKESAACPSCGHDKTEVQLSTFSSAGSSKGGDGASSHSCSSHGGFS
jgi:putative FmdB family regulatory protein